MKLVPAKSHQNLCTGALQRVCLKCLAGAFCLVSIHIGASPTLGQTEATEKPTQTEPAQSELTQGLLDLLNEPAEKILVEQSESADSNGGVLPQIQPKDIGLDGEDLGEQSERPLVAVWQSMLIAAGYLDRGVTNVQTQTLQRDILQRLDELIEQIEQPENSQNQVTQSQAEQQRTARSAGESRSQSLQSEAEKRAAAGDDSNSTSMNEPVESGTVGELVVEFSDPAALQQSVWGQLPERVRKQMQSKMVERFLPSYREQIEAYFQALLKGG